MPQPKAALRAHYRQLRRDVSPEQRHSSANKLSAHLTNCKPWSSSQHIALYLANDGEIETAAIVEQGRRENKVLYLPSIKSDGTLDFALWNDDTQLITNRYGIAEPPPTESRAEIAELDLILMPVVAWDRQGGRLGMGGGYYDKTLSDITPMPLLVGVAYSVQQSSGLELDPWDVRLDFIACEKGVYQC